MGAIRYSQRRVQWRAPTPSPSPEEEGGKKTTTRRMRLRRRDVLRCGIDTGNHRAKPRQWFTQQASPAPDIKSAPAGERPHPAHIAQPVGINRGAKKCQPYRVQPVQHRG